MLCCTVCIMLCYTVCTVLYVLCYAVVCCGVVICSIRYFTVLYALHVPYYAMLCYITLRVLKPMVEFNRKGVILTILSHHELKIVKQIYDFVS